MAGLKKLLLLFRFLKWKKGVLIACAFFLGGKLGVLDSIEM